MSWLTGILSTVRASEAADRVRVREVLERHGEQLRQAQGSWLSARPSARSVELLDGEGGSLGELDVVQAHTAPGRLHRAFSVVLVDDDGRTLLQRRAVSKRAFAGLWSNSCCSHPVGEEPLAEQAARRTREELGVLVTLEVVGAFTYRAADRASGFVEHEHDTVLVGRLPEEPLQPDPHEVAQTRLVPLDELARDVVARPSTYTPWLAQVLDCARVSDLCQGR